MESTPAMGLVPQAGSVIQIPIATATIGPATLSSVRGTFRRMDATGGTLSPSTPCRLHPDHDQRADWDGHEPRRRVGDRDPRQPPDDRDPRNGERGQHGHDEERLPGLVAVEGEGCDDPPEHDDVERWKYTSATRTATAHASRVSARDGRTSRSSTSSSRRR